MESDQIHANSFGGDLQISSKQKWMLPMWVANSIKFLEN